MPGFWTTGMCMRRCTWGVVLGLGLALVVVAMMGCSRGPIRYELPRSIERRIVQAAEKGVPMKVTYIEGDGLVQWRVEEVPR